MTTSFILIIILVILYNRRKTKYPDRPTLYGKFTKKQRIMTDTELKFYNLLKIIVNKYNLQIFTQVALNQIVHAESKRGRLQLGAKSIDFVITDNCGNIKFCIELDDYSHQRDDRIKRDNLVNEICRNANIKLIRITVEQAFIVERMEKIIKESI